ncbi:hypothetical protein NQ318_022615 [Aromia moschata]|uniref:DDE Tnp4 domain-containing protein n=1 Tax=Aromia moschata TaxID=1265417 RepID=A0AAV8XBX8_9CUCU|nr:hypothetical protein NQ318_022615 [Aromia moschata]
MFLGLERRFPILSMGIRLNIRKVEAIIVVATAVIHNIACIRNEEIPLVNHDQQEAIDLMNDIEVENVRDNIFVVNNALQ